MKYKYDLSRHSNLNTEPALWNLSERSNNLLKYMISIFPTCISDLIVNYDYNFECKLDCILTGHSKRIWSTTFLDENKILSNSIWSTLLWDLTKIPLNPIIIPISVEKICGIAPIVLTKNNILYSCIITYVCSTNALEIIEHNLIVWRNFTNDFFENANSWKIDFILSGHINKITRAVMIDTYRLASCSQDGSIKIWNLCSGNCEATFNEHVGEILRVFSLSKNRFASIAIDGTIKIWDTNTYECKYTLNNDINTLFIGLSYNEDTQAERFITLSHTSVKIWSNEDTNIYKCIRTIEYKKETSSCHLPGIENIRIRQNGTIAVIFDTTIKIFNVNNSYVSDECELVLNGHTSSILAITILPDGKIASSSKDNTIRIWEISDDAKKLINCEIISLKQFGENNLVNFLKVLPDGRLLGYSLDNTMIIWK
jgi:WD40 repeat protein